MSSPAITLRWLGVAGIEICYGDEILLVDPFLTRPPFWRLFAGRVQPNRALIATTLPQADLILVSHAHYDHLMDVPQVARQSGALVHGSANTCALLQVCGVPNEQIRQVHSGERIMVGSFKVEFIPAQHIRIPGYSDGKLRPGLRPPLRLRDYVMDESFSFLIQLPRLRLLCWNHAYQENAPQADVLFAMPSSDPARCEALLRSTQAQLVVPVHWDNFFRPLGPHLKPFFEPPGYARSRIRRVNLQRFKQLILQAAPQTQVLLPEPLIRYPLGQLLAENIQPAAPLEG